MKPRIEKAEKPPRKPYVFPQLVAYGGLTMPILMALDSPSGMDDGRPKGASGMTWKT